jgi:predicted dehydrogenase
VVAAVELNADRLKAFSDEFSIPNRFADLDAAIAWGEFDSATNVTPDQIHHPTTMKLIGAGKHVLCEKPLATSHALAMEMVEAAEKRGVINMVNLTYRAAAALSKARELVLAGEIGELRHIQASYLQSWLVGKQWGDWRTEDRWLWRLSTKHGSKGTVGDIGIHLIDFATYGAASDIASMEARTKTFHKAEGDRIGEYVLDANDSFVMNVELKNGAIGVIHATRFAPGNANELRLELYGNSGGMRVWTNGGQSSLSICSGSDVDTQTWHEIDCPPVPTVYKRFAEALRSGRNGDPSFRRAADIQRVLDLCLEAGENGPAVVKVA